MLEKDYVDAFKRINDRWNWKKNHESKKMLFNYVISHQFTNWHFIRQ